MMTGMGHNNIDYNDNDGNGLKGQKGDKKEPDNNNNDAICGYRK